jgi:hypothetical protein
MSEQARENLVFVGRLSVILHMSECEVVAPWWKIQISAFRIIMYYTIKLGLSYQLSHQNLNETCANPAPSSSTIRCWFNTFKPGLEGLDGWKCLIVEHRAKEAGKIIVREIMKEVGNRSAAVQMILGEHLWLRKLSKRWMPHLLRPEQNQARVVRTRFMLKTIRQRAVKIDFANRQSSQTPDIQ